MLPIASVYAASEQFRDEWILLRVTGKDEESNLAVGEVLEHTADHRKITRAVKQLHRKTLRRTSTFSTAARAASSEKSFALLWRRAPKGRMPMPGGELSILTLSPAPLRP
jgi:hypothetical protein